MKPYILLIILISTGLLACRKDKAIAYPVDNNLECSDFDWGGKTIALTWFSSERFQYQTPYFNPNNNNEFVYNYKDYELNEYKLMKYNIQTAVKTELASNVKIINQPKWSRKGWIAFDNVYGANYQMWIVKDNGDSLTQFTTNTSNLFPAWDATGDNLYWQHSPVLGIPYYLFKKGLYSSIVDTVMRDGDINEGYSAYNDISIDNKIISKVGIGNKTHIGYTDLNNISFTSLIDLEQSNLIGLRGLIWSNNSQIAYFLHGGLYKLNIASKKHTLLMDFCETKKYIKISCSSNGKKLIGERVDSYIKKDVNGNITGQIVGNSTIYLIDLETLEETKINLE